MMHYQCNYNESTGITGMYTHDSLRSTRIAKIIATKLKSFGDNSKTF